MTEHQNNSQTMNNATTNQANINETNTKQKRDVAAEQKPDEIKYNVDDKDELETKYDLLLICDISLCSNSNLKIVSKQENGELICNKTKAQNQSEYFQSIPWSTNKIRLKSIEANKWLTLNMINNKLECSDNSDNADLCSIPQFAVIPTDKQNIYLLKYNTKYLSSTDDGVLKVIEINKDSLTKSQQFKITLLNIYNPSKDYDIALMHSSSSTFMSCSWPDKYTVCDAVSMVPPYTTFTSIKRSKNNGMYKISLKNVMTGKYLSVNKKENELKNDEKEKEYFFGQHATNCDAENITKYEEFEIKKKKNGKYLLKSCENKYLSRNPEVLKFQNGWLLH
eukprot:527727_1